MFARLGLIALLALALPVMAQSSSGQWTADSRTGCKIWDRDPGPHDSALWSGGCSNGLASGRGVLQMFVNGKLEATYDGEYRDGKMNGDGAFEVAGWRYEGLWQNDKPNGAGKLTSPSGQILKGNWTNGCLRQGRGWVAATVPVSECGSV